MTLIVRKLILYNGIEPGDNTITLAFTSISDCKQETKRKAALLVFVSKWLLLLALC